MEKNRLKISGMDTRRRRIVPWHQVGCDLFHALSLIICSDLSFLSSTTGPILRGDAHLWHHHQIGERIEIHLDKSAGFAFSRFAARCGCDDYSIVDLGNVEYVNHSSFR